MHENPMGRRPEKNMEAAGSLVPALEGAARSALHSQRYRSVGKKSPPGNKSNQEKTKILRV